MLVCLLSKVRLLPIEEVSAAWRGFFGRGVGLVGENNSLCHRGSAVAGVVAEFCTQVHGQCHLSVEKPNNRFAAIAEIEK